MKILITGGAGFVGSSLCLHLKRKYPYYQILAFDNLKRRGSEINLVELKKHEIGFIHGDIRNKEDLELIGEFDVMVEASAEPSVLSGLNSNPSYVIQNNLIGAINCFEICNKYKAKLVFLSTSRIYPFDVIESANFEETNTRFTFSDNQTISGISSKGISEELNLSGIRSFYGATKLAAELLIMEYSEFQNMEAAVTRFGVIAGPRQMGKTDQGIASLWMAKHYFNQPLSYIGFGGTGKQVRDLLHIEDAVELLDFQIHNIVKFIGKVFNAGGGIDNSLSLYEMTLLCEKISGNKITINSDTTNRAADLKIFISDNRKIETEIGWRPKKDVTIIFRDIFKWIRKNEHLLKPIFC
ncbi:CDP-paratose 2-epimerase [Flavobacteriaceae bacterium MAR_2010_188]|nr:CDP-paratose 2-epimerase [Flavobacteriaceae bacterium MAR_2010_188]